MTAVALELPASRLQSQIRSSFSLSPLRRHLPNPPSCSSASQCSRCTVSLESYPMAIQRCKGTDGLSPETPSPLEHRGSSRILPYKGRCLVSSSGVCMCNSFLFCASYDLGDHFKREKRESLIFSHRDDRKKERRDDPPCTGEPVYR
jgi:hypothetical protein